MKEAVEKMRCLVHSLSDKEDHESVEVSVRVIREIHDALRQADTNQRVCESLEHDLIELQTQRGILVRTQDSLYAELKTYKTELRHTQGKLNMLYRAANRMREALADYTKHVTTSDAERILEMGDGA